MRDGMGRRRFLKLTAASTLAAVVGRAAAGGPAAPAASSAPAVRRGRAPVLVVASANGHEFRDGGPRTCVEHGPALHPMDSLLGDQPKG